jgi:DNA-binding NtrC family response regulator
MKVLLIDDDADLLEMTLKRFKRKGFDAESAQNLASARDILKKSADINSIVCDLFLLDGENGIDFFEKEIKATFKGKFVLATGDDTADPRIEKNKLEHKNFACFQKPYSIEEVIKFIEQ